MRRIMIARRNNLRDHEILKQARAQVEDGTDCNQTLKREAKGQETENTNVAKRRRCVTSHSLMTDDELRREMDTPAIEATRSYKAWMSLPNGHEFTYNQKYYKGREGHDWLLRKNIWRRMRYRRHNKSMVEKLKNDIVVDNGIPAVSNLSAVHSRVPDVYNTAAAVNEAAVTATQIVDHTLLAAGPVTESSRIPENSSEDNLHAAVVEAAVAAVAAAESYVNQARESEGTEIMTSYNDVKNEDSENVGIAPSVHNPIISDQATNVLDEHHTHTPNPLVSFTGEALDVAAKLAAAASVQVCKLEGDTDEKQCISI